jgi:hypothetical protein
VSAAAPGVARDARATACLVALAVLSVGLYLPNLNDYFLGDDFDLIRSFHGKPLRYFVELLWSNESGDVWKSWGIDPGLGRGYLRPLKIWLLALEFALWGARPVGFHLVSTAFFVAVVLQVFAILRRALPGRPWLAAAGAGAAAVHPVFAEVVPFITAREELAATAFGLGSFLAFLRARQEGGSLAPFVVLYALALLTKESSIVFLALPLGWDLVHGRLLPVSRATLRRLAWTWLPVLALLAGYFALRVAAFGNPKGGDGQPTHYLSPAAFLAFHAQFFRSLADPTLCSLGALPAARWLALLASLGVAWLAFRRRARISSARARALLFHGPIWYLASTAILFGTYFSVRHNLLPVIGLVLFATLLAGALFEGATPGRERARAAAFFAVAAALFLPPSLATSREYRTASAAVARLRAEIEARTADLPAGSAVSLSGVPQWVLPPFYFGWGLLSALREPFTASDLASRSTVVDARNLELTRARLPRPERFDRVVSFTTRDWVPPALEERQMQRLWREGLVPRGVRQLR